VTPITVEQYNDGVFYGPLTVTGNDYRMRPDTAARKAMDIREGSLLRMAVGERGITVAVSTDRFVDPRLYSPEFVALREQLDGLAIDRFGITCQPDNPQLLEAGTHDGQLSIATLDLAGEPTTHIPILAGPNSWPRMHTLPASAAAPGDACARLEDLLRGCSEWVLSVVVWRGDDPQFAEIAAWTPDAIQVSLRNTYRVGPQREFSRIPRDLIPAFSWLIEQAAACRTPLEHIMVRFVPRLPVDRAEVQTVSRAAWRELIGAASP
jgi:hypothetical protein